MAANPSVLDGGGAETASCLFRGALELFKNEETDSAGFNCAPMNRGKAAERRAAGVCEERALASAGAQLEALTVSAEDWE